jgi:hypothetical protein
MSSSSVTTTVSCEVGGKAATVSKNHDDGYDDRKYAWKTMYRDVTTFVENITDEKIALDTNKVLKCWLALTFGKNVAKRLAESVYGKKVTQEVVFRIKEKLCASPWEGANVDHGDVRVVTHAFWSDLENALSNDFELSSKPKSSTVKRSLTSMTSYLKKNFGNAVRDANANIDGLEDPTFVVSFYLKLHFGATAKSAHQDALLWVNYPGPTFYAAKVEYLKKYPFFDQTILKWLIR